MEVHNLKELKRALEDGNSPITTKDKKVINVILKMEHMKNKHNPQIFYETNDGEYVQEPEMKKLSNNAKGIVTESTLIILAIIGVVFIMGMYAIYKNRNVKIILNKDGTVTMEVD